ncbi:hypothetical protein KC19_3G104600 [Ceratodon purpureus]|uniref:Uncharacterized protein n=1 Tax=Ceratodon purpureus TaxID=3225 RepID=A0A8T0IJ37_CERPU|nr:hypothetical protein KC19_3G104600 [Ceratodon purpureus]
MRRERERRPSVKQREHEEFLDVLACKRQASLMAALRCAARDMANRRALERCVMEALATRRKQAVKGTMSPSYVYKKRDHPCILCERSWMQIFAPTRARGCPRQVQNQADLEKTSNRSGRGEEENERQEENEKQEENERSNYVEQDGLQGCVPKLCRSIPPVKRMRKENEWRIKAKELEEKCSELTKQVEEFRGAFTLDKLPLLAPCKCHFFNSASTEGHTTYDDYVAQSSVQIFLRNVRYLRRLNQQRIVDNYDESQEPLAMVIDFVIELSCQTKPIHLKGKYAEVYVHHAVGLIKDTIPLLRKGNQEKCVIIDNLIAKLVLDLVEKLLNFSSDLNSTANQDSAEGDSDVREKILAIILSLAEYGYIGHRILLTSSHQIAMVLERLQCMDPFDEGFSQIYENLFFMFHLVETLVAAHLPSWKEENNFGQDILEDWITCHFHCKTTLEVRPTAWTTQFMIALDSITAKLLEQLHCSAESEGQKGQDIWQKALVHLLASATSAITEM